MSDINVQSFSGKVKVSNDLIVTTNVHADYFKGNGSLLTNLPSGSGGIWVEKADGEIYFTNSNVGISNADPGHNLSVGSNLYVDDDGSNVLVVTGNVKADYFVGDGSRLTGLSGSGGVWETNGDGEIYFTDSNVGISNADPGHNLSVGSNLYVDDDGLDVLVVTGNVNATYLKGNGSLITNLPSGSGGIWSTNADNEIYFISSNVGISNADPGHDLSVGSNLYVDDDGSNVLVIAGNASMSALTLGQVSIVASYGLDDILSTSNISSNTMRLTNATTGLVTTGNVSVGNDLTVTGDLTAGYLYGDVSNVTGITSNLHQIAENGNVTSNTLQFTNATTGFVTTANVEVGGELTVTGNVTVSDDLTVTGNVSDLNIVSNVNMLHTSNTASLKLNSNVVIEFPRSKKLIKYPRVAMTADNQPTGYVASASSTNPSRDPYQAFDNILYSSWHEPVYQPSPYPNTDGAYTGGSGTVYDTNGYQGEYLQIQLPEKIKLYNYSISNRAATGLEGRQPKGAKIFASNDGTTWIDIHTHSDGGQTYDINGETRSFQLDNITETYYKYYRLVVNSIIQGGSSDTANISQWKLFGTPEYDPEADGVDVVVKSLPNVPNTDWLEVYYDGQDYTSMPATVTDKSGNNRTGTPSGGVGFDTGYKAFTFDGSNDYISSTSTATLSNHTASMWIKFDSPAAWEAVYTIKPASGFDRNNFILYLNSTYFRLESSGNTGPYYDLAYNFVIGAWVHLTLVFKSSGLEDCELYIDNMRLVPTGSKRSETDDITITGTNTIYVGSDPAGYYLDGSIANFRLFNRALTTDEIYQLYAYQKEYFGHGVLGMTLKAGRLGIGTSEPRAMLDVMGGNISGYTVPYAIGGDIVNFGKYKVHIFKSSDTFTVKRTGTFEVLIVAGGGGGGSRYGGGGGAGGLINSCHIFDTGDYVVTIGGGGSVNTRGSNSSIISNDTRLIAFGGGCGGNYSSYPSDDMDGGSGGGGGMPTNAQQGDFDWRIMPGGNSTSGQGSNGGLGFHESGVDAAGGGGGGAGKPGKRAVPGTIPGNGGTGKSFNFYSNDLVYYAGGGGGGEGNTQSGVGGTGGGGNGAAGNDSTGTLSTAGTINTGGGGGGGGSNGGSGGGGGGSGIIMIRYLT